MARPLPPGACVERHYFAVGALALGGSRTPEVHHSRLVLQIALKCFTENKHGLATKVNAPARLLSCRGFRHREILSERNRLPQLIPPHTPPPNPNRPRQRSLDT